MGETNMCFHFSYDAEKQHDRLSWILHQDFSLRRKIKNSKQHAYTWRKNPRVWREDLIFLSFSTQQLNIYEKMRLPRRSAPRNDSCVHGVSIFTWCCQAA